MLTTVAAGLASSSAAGIPHWLDPALGWIGWVGGGVGLLAFVLGAVLAVCLCRAGARHGPDVALAGGGVLLCLPAAGTILTSEVGGLVGAAAAGAVLVFFAVIGVIGLLSER
jgi:hypothetical protein